MAERRENSVLFSLRELRRIEDDRVKKEQDDATARLQAERAAREAAERAEREAIERKRREEEDRLRQIEEAKEAKEREGQIRLQEAERRARVEGEVRLQEERLRLEAHARVVHKSPIKAVIGVAAVIVLVAGIVGWKMYSNHQAELATERAERARVEAEAKAQQLEAEKRVAAIVREMNDKLASAKSDEERARIRAEAAQAQVQARAAAGSSHGSHRKDKPDAPAAVGVRKVTKKEVSDNPLEGL
jgi:hypothetical protein